MKKLLLTFVMITVLLLNVMPTFAESTSLTVNAADGTVEVKYPTTYSYNKAIVAKDGIRYLYNLYATTETLPLQLGSGEYEITLLGGTDGRRFRKYYTGTINVTLEENAVFLSASQTVNWNSESAATILAIELTEDLSTDKEKFDAIYNYVVNQVSYDYAKARTIEKGYVPSPDMTLSAGSGICYDFAALMASMLRSVDIPTKLVKGYSTYTPVYHAWNEVMIDNEWVVVDASTDSIFHRANLSINAYKETAKYLPSKVY
jgi:transglutaminase-like putative cysteine protease